MTVATPGIRTPATQAVQGAMLAALVFSAPLMTTLLSVPILKERIGLHRIGAVLVGFLGVSRRNCSRIALFE